MAVETHRIYLKIVQRIIKWCKKILRVFCWILLRLNVRNRSLKACYKISGESAMLLRFGTCGLMLRMDETTDNSMTKLLRLIEAVAAKSLWKLERLAWTDAACLPYHKPSPHRTSHLVDQMFDVGLFSTEKRKHIEDFPSFGLRTKLW